MQIVKKKNRSFENATFIAFGGVHNSLVVIMLHLTCKCLH